MANAIRIMRAPKPPPAPANPIPVEPENRMSMATLREWEAQFSDPMRKGLDREHFEQDLEALVRFREFQNDDGVNEGITKLLERVWNLVPIN
jgi:hypothetical protein